MRLFVTVVFLVLSVWTANAAQTECDCVLWENIMSGGGDFVSAWKLHRTYETNDLCESARQQAWEAKVAILEKEALSSPQMELRKVTGETVILIIKDKNGLDRTTSHGFQCLPESLNPGKHPGRVEVEPIDRCSRVSES